MSVIARAMVYLALTMFSVVSMWMTYASLHDSILLKPEVSIPLWNGVVWQCSVFALLISMAIGLMLFALKLTIIEGQRRLNLFGFVGLLLVASISIVFNVDVLYRVANPTFYERHAYNAVRSVYDAYLTDVQAELPSRRDPQPTEPVSLEAGLDAEREGLGEDPAGLGAQEGIDPALAAREKVEALLAKSMPDTVEGVAAWQEEIRAAAKPLGELAGKPLPPAARVETPLSAVFANLMDWQKLGFMEVFILALAVLLDLGDIVGYSLIPNQPKKRRSALPAMPEFDMPEMAVLPPTDRIKKENPPPESLEDSFDPFEPRAQAASSPRTGPPPRPLRLRRRR
jgi:hypothetical protein